MSESPSSIAIACAGTGLKAAFVHGVLAAFESHGVRADVYAGSSQAALPALLAAREFAGPAGADFWTSAHELLELTGNGLSDVLLAQIRRAHDLLGRRPIGAWMPRLVIATTAVQTVAGAIETQGSRAGALGRRLIVHGERHDRSWATEHLLSHIWDSEARDSDHQITPETIDQVLYASGRLLHACAIPAEIDGMPHIDGVYSCACPVMELAAMGYREIIAITPDPGPLYRDLFRTATIPEMAWRSRVRIIRPTASPKSLGVEETIARDRGLIELYDHGLDRGLDFWTEHLDPNRPLTPLWAWPAKPAPVDEQLSMDLDPAPSNGDDEPISADPRGS